MLKPDACMDVNEEIRSPDIKSLDEYCKANNETRAGVVRKAINQFLGIE